MDKAKKNDWIEIKYTGYANGDVFDSNKEEDLKKLDPNAKGKETVICVGQKMLVPGFDKAIEGKDLGKDYEISFGPKEGFGERRRELVKTVPLSSFREHKVDPKPGMVFDMGGQLIRVAAVSGARVITDFNNPLAGKDLVYKFNIVKMVSELDKKVKGFFENTVKFIPDFEEKDGKVVVKGPKQLESFVLGMATKFKELVGTDLGFEEVKEEKKK